jgi:2-oxoglutarate dehydrogenase E2 component (dihydrolipoamide succinyltransferase)
VVEVDLSRVARRIEQCRATWLQRGVEPSYTPFFAQALVAGVAAAPQVNAAFDAEARGIRHYHALHVGLSVQGTDGKTARHTVVRDADTRNLLGLAIEAQDACERGATDSDILGEATITLSDFGPGSALFAVPLVIPGHAAAVRAGSVEERLVARERGFFLTPTVYLCASVDHRVLDGMDAGALLHEMKRFLEQFPLEPEA